MLELAIGIGLLGGAAWAGRRHRNFAGLGPPDPKFASDAEDISYEAMDAADEARRWFDHTAEEEGYDPCQVRSPYFKALDVLKRARRFHRAHAADHAKFLRSCPPKVRRRFWVPEAWGGDKSEVPISPCEAWAASQQYIDDAFNILHDAQSLHEMRCKRTLPDPKLQPLDARLR